RTEDMRVHLEVAKETHPRRAREIDPSRSLRELGVVVEVRVANRGEWISGQRCIRGNHEMTLALKGVGGDKRAVGTRVEKSGRRDVQMGDVRDDSELQQAVSRVARIG